MYDRIMLLLCVILCTLTACDTSTCPQIPEPDGPPWQSPDSAYKVIENLEYAYNTLDYGLFLSCIRQDFEFHPLEISGHDPWDHDMEAAIHDSMFGTVYGNELDLWGSAEWPWSGDSTGESMELSRACSLDVMITEWEGFRSLDVAPSPNSHAKESAYFTGPGRTIPDRSQVHSCLQG